MKEVKIKTRLGQISVAIDGQSADVPIVFMHGVFLDKTLWDAYGPDISGRKHIYIDMPAHGASSNVGRDWSLDDCVTMLIDILNELEIERCVIIGHSWGSMTALRAANLFPSRFAAACLFNMPFKRSTGAGRWGFTLQKTMVFFRKFYARQAANSLYTKEFLSTHPEYSTQMEARLSLRPPKEISRVIDAVILEAKDSTTLIEHLTIPVLAIVGKSDYVGIPPKIDARVVPGGHISPHEAPEETRQAIKDVLALLVTPNNSFKPTPPGGAA
jgi:pimeloyl-ACP methyl ester carboxylesterase